MKIKLVTVIAFIVGFLGVKYGLEYYRESQAISKATQEIEALREEARTQHPDEPEVLVVQEAAIRKAEDNIRSKGSQKKKIQTAASTFLGFYLVNYRKRAEYCEKEGVDISQFTSAFRDSHIRVYETAINAIDYSQSDLNKLYNMLDDQLQKVIDQDMKFIAEQNSISVADACKLLADSADVIVPELQFSVMQPYVYDTLMSGH